VRNSSLVGRSSQMENIRSRLARDQADPKLTPERKKRNRTMEGRTTLLGAVVWSSSKMLGGEDDAILKGTGVLVQRKAEG
jgi:hypothetical protein